MTTIQRSLVGKVAVVTGATSGIGQVAAMALAAQGAKLWVVARDRALANALLVRLPSSGADPHEVVIADLSLCAEALRAGGWIAAQAPKVDILLNNAGAFFDVRELTSEGLERTFALNHMAYFAMTKTLMPKLRAAGQARIVSTASSSHSHVRLDLNDLQNASRIGFANAYARSKLCNVLWTRELARRLAGSGITANCFHPGFVRSEIGDDLQRPGLRRFFKLAKFFGRSTAAGADTAIYLASSPNVAEATGGYWIRRRCSAPSTEAQSSELAVGLWDASEAILANLPAAS